MSQLIVLLPARESAELGREFALLHSAAFNVGILRRSINERIERLANRAAESGDHEAARELQRRLSPEQIRTRIAGALVAAECADLLDLGSAGIPPQRGVRLDASDGFSPSPFEFARLWDGVAPLNDGSPA